MGKIILLACQFGRCLALSETPAVDSFHLDNTDLSALSSVCIKVVHSAGMFDDVKTMNFYLYNCRYFKVTCIVMGIALKGL